MSAAALAAVGLSLISAVAYALAAVAQERLAGRGAGSSLVRLLGTGAWWAAVGLNAAAALLHVVALKYGPLTLVQPLGALTWSRRCRSGRGRPGGGSARRSGAVRR